jgi:hypothetical protein
LHRRAHAIAVAKKNVFAQADFVAVVKHRRAGQGKEQGVEQFDALAVVAQQRRQPAADAQIEPRLIDLGIHPVHVIALLVGDHGQGQLVVVPQEQRPLAGFGMAGVCSRISTMGRRSSMRNAMNNLGISGK